MVWTRSESFWVEDVFGLFPAELDELMDGMDNVRSMALCVVAGVLSLILSAFALQPFFVRGPALFRIA